MTDFDGSDALTEIRAERLRKKELLREHGMDPYPSTSEQTHTVQAVRSDFEALESAATEFVIAGRVMAVRVHGGLAFVDIFDGTDTLQGYFREDHIDQTLFSLLVDTVDRGDFIEVRGIATTTKRGEPSCLASSWRILAKSLLPIPTEHFGIKDEDERYRKRYLDILLNGEVADRIKRRSVFWNTARAYMLERGFVEVETPVLETTPGGAEARPFATHHNALNIDVYLRISAGELWQKKLMVAGLPKTFEIGRIFRNEGMSSEHLQDYTQLECYEAYSDYTKGKVFVRELYLKLAQETYGKTEFTIGEHTIDLASEWQEYDFCALVKERYGVDPREVGEAEVVVLAQNEKLLAKDEKGVNRERAVDLLWKQLRKGIGGPGFLVNVPTYLEPLAKRSAQDDRIVERFQVLLAGSEVGKGFSELNDPLDQRQRFERQQELRAAGDDEAQPNDLEYVEALEYGMPPTFGFGVSERLFSFLEGVPVREGQIFPLMRPRG